jgi:hypothetical protein
MKLRGLCFPGLWHFITAENGTLWNYMVKHGQTTAMSSNFMAFHGQKTSKNQGVFEFHDQNQNGCLHFEATALKPSNVQKTNAATGLRGQVTCQ